MGQGRRRKNFTSSGTKRHLLWSPRAAGAVLRHPSPSPQNPDNSYAPRFAVVRAILTELQQYQAPTPVGIESRVAPVGRIGANRAGCAGASPTESHSIN